MDSLRAIDNFVTSFLTGRSRTTNSYKQQPASHNNTTAATPQQRREEQSQEQKKLPSSSANLNLVSGSYIQDVEDPANLIEPCFEVGVQAQAVQYTGHRQIVKPRRVRYRRNRGRKQNDRILLVEDSICPAPPNRSRHLLGARRNSVEEYVQTRTNVYRINDQISRRIEMSKPFPYTYISCPCTDISIPGQPALQTGKGGVDTTGGEDDNLKGQQGNMDEDDEKTFDPRSPRANYSLYPPEHLLYCEDCHQIKCPRCITEEIVCWYCPNCLFETPSSMVKSEGNRYGYSLYH